MATAPLTLLQERDSARRRHRLELYEHTRRLLKGALAELIPGQKVIVFGSLTRPGIFNDRSDIDLALEEEPPQMSEYRLISELMDRLERPVDVLLLSKSRLREKILREGEVWTA